MDVTHRTFFGFSKEPFGSDLDLSEILQTPELMALKERFDYTLTVGAMALITGEIGSGKSTALRYATGQLHPSEYTTFYVTASSGSILELYRQILAELDRRVPGRIGEVADLMAFSEQRLVQVDTGSRVRTAQDRAVELLDQLIDRAEQMEQNAAAQAASPSPRSGDRQQPGTPSAPKPESRADSARAAEGGKRPGRRIHPGEAWGNMPTATRQRILQALQDDFPDRYRALVEQYYRELAEQP